MGSQARQAPPKSEATQSSCKVREDECLLSYDVSVLFNPWTPLERQAKKSWLDFLLPQGAQRIRGGRWVGHVSNADARHSAWHAKLRSNRLGCRCIPLTSVTSSVTSHCPAPQATSTVWGPSTSIRATRAHQIWPPCQQSPAGSLPPLCS